MDTTNKNKKTKNVESEDMSQLLDDALQQLEEVSPALLQSGSTEGNVEDREYFSGAQKRHIKAMVSNGIDLETAKQKERERYAAYKTKMGIKDDSIIPGTLKRMRPVPTGDAPREKQARHDSSGEDVPSPNDDGLPRDRKNFSGAQRRRIKAMILSGIEPDEARRMERERHTAKVKSANPSTVRTNDNWQVDILHGNHPEEKLTKDQILLIRTCLLDEVHKTKEGNMALISTDVYSDRLFLICRNEATNNWLKEIITQIEPFEDAKLKFSQITKLVNDFVCTMYIPPKNVLDPEVLKKRLAKQNVGLLTDDWRLVKKIKESNKGETITFSVDEQSKNQLVAKLCKLSLNSSEIFVNIKEAAKLTNTAPAQPTKSIRQITNISKTKKNTKRKPQANKRPSVGARSGKLPKWMRLRRPDMI